MRSGKRTFYHFGLKTVFLSSAAALALLAGQASAQAAALPQINASLLPNARTGTVGSPVTVFATISNSGPGIARQCQISLDTITQRLQSAAPGQQKTPQASQVDVSYQAYQSDNATPAAPVNTPIDIPAGTNQAFVLTLTPNTTLMEAKLAFNYTCTADSGGSTVTIKAKPVSGVNKLLLTAVHTPAPDVLTIGVSPSNDGIIHIPSLGGGQVMAVAAINIGTSTLTIASDQAKAGSNETAVIAVPDFSEAAGRKVDLPLDAFICETDPATAQCLQPYAREVHTHIGDQPSTFNIFTNSTKGAGVPLFADLARQFIRFYVDTSAKPAAGSSAVKPAAARPSGAGALLAGTSLAVTSPGPAVSTAHHYPEGIWSAFDDISDGRRLAGTATVDKDGNWVAAYQQANGNFVYQKGSLSTNTTVSPPGLALMLNSYEDNVEGDQNQAGFTGSGSWEPKSFLNFTITPNGTPPPPVAAADVPVNDKAAQVRTIYNTSYDRQTALADLQGNYDILDMENLSKGAIGTVTVATDGSLNGSLSPDGVEQCTVGGSIMDLGNGKNLFGMDMQLSNCSAEGFFSGSAYQRLPADQHLSSGPDEILTTIFSLAGPVAASFDFQKK